MTGKHIKKVTYRDYREYPVECLSAARMRDSFSSRDAMALILYASREHALTRLAELAEWEDAHATMPHD